MKMVSKLALGAALALGGTAMMVSPAIAQKKEKAAKAPSFNLSKPVREAAAAAQAALAAGDTATALAKVSEARAAAKTPDDQYVASSILYDISRKTNDQKQAIDAVKGMVASGKVAPDQQPQMQMALGSLAYNAKDFAAAEPALQAAIDANPGNVQAYALLSETKVALNKPAEAVAVIEAASQKERAAGRKLPAEYYARGVSIGYKAKLVQPIDRLTQQWLMDYPTQSNWRDALIIYRDLNKVDADTELDILRMLRTAGALKGERDYMEIVQATYLKFPAEAKAVLEEGQKAGQINTAAGNPKELLALVNGRISADRASLSKSAPNGRAALAAGDAYLSYGQYADAAEMYRQALAKGGADANIVNTHLGQALFKAGDKAGAKAAFAAVTGPRTSLARYWTIWIDQQA